MVVTLFGIVTSIKEFPLKAPSPIFVRLLSVSKVRLLNWLNRKASLPILVTLFPIVTRINDLLDKAKGSMLVTLRLTPLFANVDGMITAVPPAVTYNNCCRFWGWSICYIIKYKCLL